MTTDTTAGKGTRTHTLAIGAAATLAITLGIGGTAFGYHYAHRDDATPTSMSAAESSEQSAQASPSSTETSTSETAPTPTATMSTAPACPDGSPAPDGTCLYPASVQWLPDLLPDPREVDRTNPEAVARAYVITRNVWDASRDKTNAYAYIRASVYEVPELASNHTKTPNLEHGQGEFLPLLANRAHTTVTITGSNNHGQQPNTDPTRWYGNVYYLRNYSDDSLEPVKGREVVFLRLQDDGTWAVERHGIN